MVTSQQLNINSLISAMALMVILAAFFRMVNKMLFAEERGLLPQTKKYLTILDAGDTIFQEGEVVSPEAYERENERVKKLGLRPAFGKHLADILPPRAAQTEPQTTGYRTLKLFDEKEPFFVYLRPGEDVAAATKFRMAQLETKPGYKYTVFIVIQEKGRIIDIQGYHMHEDPQQDYHVYWLPHYRPPDEIMTRIEKDAGFRFPPEIWRKPPKFLHLSQTEPLMPLTIKRGFAGVD